MFDPLYYITGIMGFLIRPGFHRDSFGMTEYKDRTGEGGHCVTRTARVSWCDIFNDLDSVFKSTYNLYHPFHD